jgi:DNA integrity scanning protein DisA with diadenylate cyclase activity
LLEQNRAMINGAIAVAKESGADAIILAAAADGELEYLTSHADSSMRIIAAAGGTPDLMDADDREIVVLPQLRLRRRGRAKVALLEALARGALKPGEDVVVISGSDVDDTMVLDTIAMVKVAAPSGIFDGDAEAPIAVLRAAADPAVFDAALTLCVELGHDGREGKPVGMTLTLGDHEHVLQRSHPHVLNPFQGHVEEDRNILVPSARRAIREFSGMDGAFVVTRDGIVVAGGRYLQDVGPDTDVPNALGARHRAAAGITAATRAISFCVSESTGDTRVFGDGRLIMTIARAD